MQELLKALLLMYKIPKEIHLCTLTISIDRKRDKIHFSRNIIVNIVQLVIITTIMKALSLPAPFQIYFYFWQTCSHTSCLLIIFTEPKIKQSVMPIDNSPSATRQVVFNKPFLPHSNEVCKSLLKLKSLGQRASVMTDESLLSIN